jgi:3-methyladenine DNA glycosylase AlkD
VATYETVMEELRSQGTSQNAKIYRRHGAGGEIFGVSFATLGALKKKLKTDHDLARALWASGSYDARVLATMIADPQQMTAADLDAWAATADSYPVADALARNLAARLSPPPWETARRWIASPDEWVAYAGWQLLSILALQDGSADDEALRDVLRDIEGRIHGSQNRVRYGMNSAVIAIGSRSPALAEAATATAGRIGKVEVDHGQTDCKTPDAGAYIERIWARKTSKAGKTSKGKAA